MAYVLIVELDRWKREALRLRLSAANHTVEVAETWAMAGRMVASGKFDMVVCTEAPPAAFVVPKRGGITRVSLSSTPSSALWLALVFEIDPLVAYAKMAALCFAAKVLRLKDDSTPVHATGAG